MAFNEGNDDPILRYAILSDTHIRPPSESSSPWKTNLLTIDRARWVVNSINTQRPDFIVHLGDIVHPVPTLPTHSAASHVAKEIMGISSSPCYLVPGNHDVGDKKNPMVPSHIVNDEFINFYKKSYGLSFNSFDSEDLHFITINSSILNSGLSEENAQRKWLENDLAENKGRRIHLFSHYPPFIYDAQEDSNYDNVDEPARKWLLDLIHKYRVEIVFAGHVHHFFYNRYSETSIYNIPSTCNLRQDYANLFRVASPEEFGRNDTPKLGYCIVDVYGNGYDVKIRRSYGQALPDGINFQSEDTVEDLNSTRRHFSSLGVQVRYPLSEVTELPYMGPLDEFVRKKARNDYTFLALSETGIKIVRIPISDLYEERTKQRLIDLHKTGLRYGFFSVNIPKLEIIKKNKEIIEFLEIIIPWDEAKHTLPQVSLLRRNMNIPIYVANIESSVHRKSQGSKFSHYIGHGFHADNFSKLKSVLDIKGHIDGLTFEVGQFEDILQSIKRIRGFSLEHGVKAIINIRLSSEDPAEYLDDDNYTANRVVEAAIAGYIYPEVKIFLDTFMDHDRGYFPRIGLYDRRLNPRRSATVLKNIDHYFAGKRDKVNIDSMESDDEWKKIMLKNSENQITIKLPQRYDSIPVQSNHRVIDLTTGIINSRLSNGVQHLEIRQL